MNDTQHPSWFNNVLNQSDFHILKYAVSECIASYEDYASDVKMYVTSYYESCNKDDTSTRRWFVKLNESKDDLRYIKLRIKKLARLQWYIKRAASNDNYCISISALHSLKYAIKSIIKQLLHKQWKLTIERSNMINSRVDKNDNVLNCIIKHKFVQSNNARKLRINLEKIQHKLKKQLSTSHNF